jgi:predicted RNase H-related nuclease YkuK (DUF458 family)
MAMSMFNRTIQDRCFAIFLSVVLMIPTGGGLWLYYTIDHSGDSKDLLSRLFLHVGMEIVTAAFLCGVLGVVWAIFMPTWIDRAVRFVVDHFVKALAIFLCIILAMFAFTWFTLYH